MTNLEGRVLRRRRLLDPPPGVRSDLSVLHEPAVRLGEPPHRYPASPREVLMSCAAPPGAGPPTTPASATTASTPGKHCTGPAETLTPERPLWATTGRVLVHHQSGTQTRRVPELDAAAPEAFVAVHPDTAQRADLCAGKLAVVTPARGSTVARVRLVGDMRTDTVFLPFHFPDAGRANLITNTALDPRSGMPEFEVCAVRIGPA